MDAGPSIVTSALACRIVGALLPVAMLLVGKSILDAVQVRFTAGTLRSDFWWLVAGECALAVTGAMLARLTGFFDGMLANRFTRHVSVRVMEHAATLDLATYEDPAFQDVLERARVQATDRIVMMQALGSVLQQSVTVVALAAPIVHFSPWLLVLLVAAVVPVFIGESHFAFLGYSLNLRQTPPRRQLDYFRMLGASRDTGKELRLFGLAPFIAAEYSRLSDQIYSENVGLAKRRLFAGLGLAAISAGSYYSAYAYVIYRTVHGDLSWGSLQLLAGAIGGASTAVQSLFATFALVADQSLFLSDLATFFAVEPATRSRTSPVPVPVPRPIRSGLVFEGVSFGYPGASRPVLSNLDLRIEAGERVALVGANGQGKTTIVKLLTRLYDPTAGRILLDGIDLRSFAVEDLQREFGVIFQDFVRFDLTARENIALGRIDPPARNDEIELAARKSLANVAIARLPHGYDQRLGRRFDGGVDLSGGEWQKLALARAYLRDAQIVILDEPTASLDAESEFEVFRRFNDLSAGKTAMLISHRFSTVRMADRIIVLADGRVAEHGPHASLMARRGRYAAMFDLQASSYR